MTPDDLTYETNRMLAWANDQAIAALSERLASTEWDMLSSQYKHDAQFQRDSVHEIAGIKAALEILSKGDQ